MAKLKKSYAFRDFLNDIRKKEKKYKDIDRSKYYLAVVKLNKAMLNRVIYDGESILLPCHLGRLTPVRGRVDVGGKLKVDFGKCRKEWTAKYGSVKEALNDPKRKIYYHLNEHTNMEFGRVRWDYQKRRTVNLYYPQLSRWSKRSMAQYLKSQESIPYYSYGVQ